MDHNLNEEALKARVAKLESQIDHLESELTYMNGLLIEVGFPEGITTLKATAEELLADGLHQKHVEGY
ncbi:MAG: hypothetical protein H7A38_02910 [Chlamydiales bacterium]|nr:hypothetical protein [Chlamydiales bacterium]